MRSIRSKRACNSAGVRHVHGSHHRADVPWERSTTPFSWGRRGLFQCIPRPRPISHSDRSVGKSPREPQGQPLSTRKRPGKPQRTQARRSCSRTASRETFCQAPRGENRSPQHCATAFVDQTKPTYFFTSFYSDMFFCIHLPNFMGRGRPVEAGPWWSSRRGRRQAGSYEPTLERSLRGNGSSRRLQEELHSDQGSPPGGVLSAQAYGGLHQLGGRGLGNRRVPVIRWKAVDAVETKPLEETADGGARQAQRLGDLASPVAFLPEPEHRLTDRDGDGTWHDETSQKHFHETNHSHTVPMLWRDQTWCRDFAIKRHVA